MDELARIKEEIKEVKAKIQAAENRGDRDLELAWVNNLAQLRYKENSLSNSGEIVEI